MTHADSRFLAYGLALVFMQAGAFSVALAEDLPGLRLTLEHGQFFPKDKVNPALAPDPTEELATSAMDLSWVAGSLQLAPHHKIDFDFTNLSGGRRAGLDLHREFAYTLLRPGSEAEGDPDLRIYKVDYSYSLLRDRKWDLWGSVGVQIMDLDLGSLGPELRTDSTAERQLTPLPVLGLGGELNLSPNWYLKGGIRYSDGSLGDWGGNGLDAKLSVEYSAFDRMGIGLSYDFVSIGLDQNRADAQNYYGLRYDGVGIYARFSLD